MKFRLILYFVFWVTFLGFRNPIEALSSVVPGSALQRISVVPGWREITNTNAPGGRFGHTAIWTGSEMIVFGGIGGNPYRYLNDGGRYNPSTDSWTTLPSIDAPSARTMHTAIWTGVEMIIWGGVGDGGSTAEGARYNPATNQWTPVSTDGAPTARYDHSAVWTGSEMIVWGGTYLNDAVLNDGARYNPYTDQWTPLPQNEAPSARQGQAVVWTGSEMILWGGAGTGHLNDGGRYNPTTNDWTPLPTDGAPEVWAQPTAIWTGSNMIAWGGIEASVASYNPATNSWTPLSTGNTSDRSDYTMVWTGMDISIWGGWDGYNIHNDGVRYNPVTHIWVTLPLAGAPSARTQHTAIWTGSEMIIWGGRNSESYLGDGALLRIYYTSYFPWVRR